MEHLIVVGEGMDGFPVCEINIPSSNACYDFREIGLCPETFLPPGTAALTSDEDEDSEAMSMSPNHTQMRSSAAESSNGPFGPLRIPLWMQNSNTDLTFAKTQNISHCVEPVFFASIPCAVSLNSAVGSEARGSISTTSETSGGQEVCFWARELPTSNWSANSSLRSSVSSSSTHSGFLARLGNGAKRAKAAFGSKLSKKNPNAILPFSNVEE